jgi:hypothetical protein
VVHALHAVATYRFLVQEWCQSTLGQALRSWLLHKKETREPLLDLLLGLLIDVAQGVLYLHDRQIIHGGRASECDVTPVSLACALDILGLVLLQTEAVPACDCQSAPNSTAAPSCLSMVMCLSMLCSPLYPCSR